ncbi:MAG: Hpt domain-containing protein [Pseudomonadota bacterium]
MNCAFLGILENHQNDLLILARYPRCKFCEGAMIDWDRVKELRTDFGEDDFEEIVTMFLAEVEEKLEKMCADTSDDLSEDYHFLKGGAANLGFADLQSLCSKAEAGGSRDDLGAIRAAFAESKDVFLARM